MRKVAFTQPATGAWGASATIATDIERVGSITRIDAVFEITPSATLRAAHQFDPLHRTIDTWRLRGGSTTYFTLPSDAGGHGGTLLHYMNYLDGFGVGHRGAAIAAPDSTYNYARWVLHAGSRPKDKYGRDDPYDLSAFIPAEHDSALIAEWVTTANTVMDDTVTLTSGTMRYTVYRVLGSPAEMAEEMQRQEVHLPPGATGMVPMWSAQTFSQTGTSTEFTAQAVDVSIGAYLKRIGLVIQDATATRPLRASDEVTEVALRIAATNEELLRVGFETLNARLPIGTGLHDDSGAAVNAAVATLADPDFNGFAPSGIGFIDLRGQMQSLEGRDYGWNLIGEPSGAAYRLGFIIDTYAAGDDILILWERYGMYHGPVGK